MTAAGTAGRALAIFALMIASLFISVSAAAAAAPANDAFADAEVLPEFVGEKSGSNVEATKESGEPHHAGNPGGHSVWFSWTPSSSRMVGIQSGNCFGGPDLIAVYTGPSVDSLSPVASNQSATPPTCFFTELPQAEFEATAGTTYWIAVDGRDGAQGSFNLRFNGEPDNDDFANPTTVGPATPQNVFSTSRLGSKEAGEPNHGGDAGGHSVWFSWTPEATEPVRIATCTNSSSLDAVLSVYTGSQLDSLTEVAGNDETAIPLSSGGCRQSDSAVTVNAVAGTTYRIAVDGAGGTAGRFNLLIQGRPVNDDFDSAQAMLPGIPSFISNGSNVFATEESGEPDHAGDPGGRSVWYSWTAPSSGRVRVATCTTAGSMDSILAVYTGADLASATLVAAGDEGTNGYCTYGSEVAIDAVAGTTYMIAVDGKGGDQGGFGLSIEAPPANDDFADAKALPETLSVSTSGSTTLGSKESGEPNHAGNPGGRSVWFSWTAPSSGPVAISACPFFEESPDTLLAVYTGGAVGSLTPVTANDDSSAACQEAGSEARFQAVAGTTYRIAVDGKGGSQGFFSLDIGGRPGNDTFATPEVLPAEPMMAGGSTLFTSKEAGEPNHAGNSGGHSVWFSWTPSSSGPVEITACGRNGVDTLLAVYTGGAVNALTPVASNDDLTGAPQNEMCQSPRDSAVVLNTVAGTTYRIAVDTKDSEGRFGMGFIPAAGNDDFADADVLYAGLPSFGSESTTFATREAGEPNHAGSPGGHSVWYSWTAPVSGPVLASTCTREAGFDTLLGVYTGSSVGSLTPVASGDDGQSRKGCSPTDSEAQFTATAGTTYRIAVDGKGGAAGSFQLVIEGLAPNDDFGKAQPLGGGLPAAWQFTSNRFATAQAGEPDHAGDAGGSSVWFKWTAPRSGTVSVDTCGSGFDSLLAVYTGGTVGGLTPVQSNDDGSGWCSPQSRLTFEAVANTTYRIAVDGKGGAQGPLQLHVEERSENDDFETAETIPGRAGWYWPGSTILATKQAGEPNHAGNPGGHSVWYSWTPRKDWALELDACTDGFQPLLAVYTGTTLAGLAPVAVTDGGSGECYEGSSVGFDAVAGTTYWFAVDGPGGDEGRFELHLRSADTPVVPPAEPPVLNPGGGGPSGGGVVPPIATPPPPGPKPKKPLRCKRGFKKKVVKGKARCVKKKKKAKKGKQRRHR